jgi:hypothetical protein
MESTVEYSHRCSPTLTPIVCQLNEKTIRHRSDLVCVSNLTKTYRGIWLTLHRGKATLKRSVLQFISKLRVKRLQAAAVAVKEFYLCCDQ